MPGADPALAVILSDYAEQFLATVRPVWSWLDTGLAEIVNCWPGSAPELRQVGPGHKST
jgi:hypothetical protein